MYYMTNGATFYPTDLAFHPNGNLYAVADGGSLYTLNTATLGASFVGNFNVPTLGFVNSLVCDENGVLYAADYQLYTVDAATGQATLVGPLPCTSAGDLAFNAGELYLACSGNSLLQIDLQDTNNSTIVGTMKCRGRLFWDCDLCYRMLGY